MKKIAIGDRRLIITKNLIMMLVMLVVIFVAIFAWYSNNNEVTASGTTISAKSADNVELAVPEKDQNGNDVFPINNASWKTELDFSDSGYLKNFVKDITSGGKQFVLPSFEAAKGLKDGRTVITSDAWTEGLSSKVALTNESTLDDDQYNYISVDFYIRSKQKDINVTADSFLAAGSELGYQDAEHPSPNEENSENNSQGIKPLVKPDNNNNNPIYRTSSYGAAEGQTGSFSSDAIVGAMRVSLEGCLVDGVNNSGAETSYDGGTWATKSDLRFLWLPRPDVYLQTDDNSNNWKLFTGIKPSGNSAQNGKTAEQVDALANDTYSHSFYEGKYVGSNEDVKKGLDHHKYSDSLVKSVSGSDATVPGYFKVSKITSNDTNVGTTGYYPTLGQSLKITGNPNETNLNTSKQIEFTVQNGQPVSGYYVYKYTLNIWIEGEDAEARRSMNNGVFSLELDFGT